MIKITDITPPDTIDLPPTAVRGVVKTVWVLLLCAMHVGLLQHFLRESVTTQRYMLSLLTTVLACSFGVGLGVQVRRLSILAAHAYLLLRRKGYREHFRMEHEQPK